jgi:hypothetical protein
MYAIISDWMPFVTEAESEAPTDHSIKINKKYSREEEFRSAVDSYMADYRKHHATIANKARGTHNTRFTFLPRLANWNRR